MPLTVVCFAAYLTSTDEEWRPEDHAASKMVKLVKGKSINGYAVVSVGPKQYQLFNGDQQSALKICARWVRNYAGRKKLWDGAKIRLVPIPSSDAVKGAAFTRFPARDLANAVKVAAVQNEMNVSIEVADILRWRKRKTKSHEGGSRDPFVLYENLLVTEEPEPDVQHVLVDDVCTGGGHLRASRLRLEESGAVVKHAFCIGKTVQSPPDDPFEVIAAELPDFVVRKAGRR